jgi:hypothetical protein
LDPEGNQAIKETGLYATDEGEAEEEGTGKHSRKKQKETGPDGVQV